MILTLGDSFTYGEELADRLDTAWPYLIAKKQNLPVLNLGHGGGSNDMIVRTAVEQTAQQKFELVIVGWADTSRLEVWDYGTNTPVCINHHGRRQIPWVPDYYKYNYNKTFGFRKWFTQILLLQEYFKSISQPYLFVNVAGLQGHYEEYQKEFGYIWDKYDQSNYLGWPIDGMLEWQGDCPRGPGGHPLELGHQRIAEKINDYIGHISRVS